MVLVLMARDATRGIGAGEVRSRAGAGAGARARARGAGPGFLALLLLVADPAGFGLGLADLAEVEADGARAEGVGLGGAAAELLVGGPEAADEGVQAAPRLAERAGAGARRVWVPIEWAALRVHLRLPELVQVAQELQHVRAAAPRQRERRTVVPQVLPERVPIPTLLRFVTARRRKARARARAIGIGIGIGISIGIGIGTRHWLRRRCLCHCRA